MECPRCGLVSPESALRCDCGYNFSSRHVDSVPPSIPETGEAAPLPKMWIGFALAVLTFVTIVVEVAKNPGFADEKTPIGYYLIFSVASWVYWLWCVHRYHDIMTSIPGYRHPVSPGQAVARHFIPFYNFYWVFKWPTEIATFVNWRMQTTAMHGWIAGLLVLSAVIVGRAVDVSLGQLVLFSSGVYISRQIRRALAAPPVPESAMVPPGVTSTLGLS